MRCSTHCSHDKGLASPVINEKKQKEIIFLPCLVCLLGNGSVNKWYELHERRELSMIKLTLRLTHSAYKNARKKRKNQNNKTNVCQLHNNHIIDCNTVIIDELNQQLSLQHKRALKVNRNFRRFIYLLYVIFYIFLYISYIFISYVLILKVNRNF